MLAVQGQSSLHGNDPDSNQRQDMNGARLNWKANITCYKCGDKGHLAQECPHIGSSAIAQRKQTAKVYIQQANYTGSNLFPATESTFSQIITSETSITSEILLTLMEQLNRGKSR